MAFDTPILFLIFNRPALTVRVFEQIRKQQPRYLYVAADGPRPGNETDEIQCRATRDVITNIDWDCELKTLYRDKNLGCGKAVSEAITWFFEHVEEGIILEDDTLPDISFFKYCESLLCFYRNNERIMHISGCYFFHKYETLLPKSSSYNFSKHIHVWGWATWKRAWSCYDFSMNGFTREKNEAKNYFGQYYNFWIEIFSATSEAKIDTWDYQWMYSIFLRNGIAINPSINLIKNIGFDFDATHTKDGDSIYSSLPTESMETLNHQHKIKIDKQRDELYYKIYLNIEIKRRLMLKENLSKLIRKISSIKRNLNSDNKVSIIELNRLKRIPRFESTKTFFLGKRIDIVDASTFLSSYSEIFERNIYKFNSKERVPVIIDCGANIGIATIYFKVNYPNARIIAFEPDPKIFAALKSNIESFQFNDIELFNVAIGNNEETLLFNMEGGHSGMLVAEFTDKSIPVPVKSLREILSKFDRVEFLKIDIEGNEINVIPDIAGELSKVNNLFLEYHTFIDQPQNLSKIIGIIEAAGFRYYIKEAACKESPYLERELFYKMDMLVNIFCYR